MITAERTAKIASKIEEAAKHLNPILAGGDLSTAEIQRRVHDALNSLTSALAQTHFLGEDL